MESVYAWSNSCPEDRIFPHWYLGKHTVSSKSMISFCLTDHLSCLATRGFGTGLIFFVLSLEAEFQTFQGKKFHPLTSEIQKMSTVIELNL